MNEPWHALPKVELLMQLEKIRTQPRTSAGAGKIRSALRQAENAIRAAEEMKAALRAMLQVQDALMPGVRYIAVQNYAQLNDAPLAARKAIDAYLHAIPERVPVHVTECPGCDDPICHKRRT